MEGPKVDIEEKEKDLQVQSEASGQSDNIRNSKQQEEEVSEWEELLGEDICLKTIQPGEGEMAEVNHLVRISYIGRVITPGHEGIFEVEEDDGFRIGESETTPGLELGIRHFRKGMKGIIKVSSKYGYGPLGRQKKSKKDAGKITCNVPPNAEIEYEVTCIDIYPPFNHAEASLEQKLFEGNLKKLHGNDFTFHEDYNRALRCYSSGLKALNPGEQNTEEDADDLSESEEEMDYKEMEDVDDIDEDGDNLDKGNTKIEKRRMNRKTAKESRKAHRAELMKEVWKLFVDMHNNMSICLHQLGKYKEVKEAVMKILEVDPNNVKALYRGGMAALMLSDFEEAKLALEEALKLMPDDPLIKRGYAEYQKKYNAYLKKNRQMQKDISAGVWKSRPEKQEEQKHPEDDNKEISDTALGNRGDEIETKEAMEEDSQKIQEDEEVVNVIKEDRMQKETKNETFAEDKEVLDSDTGKSKNETSSLTKDPTNKSNSYVKVIRLWVFVIFCFLVPIITSWDSIVFYFNHRFNIKLPFGSHTETETPFVSSFSQSASP